MDERTIGAHIHGHTDNVYPGQNGGAKQKEDKEKGYVNTASQYAATH
ncbi:hypothetical protein [Pseudomonas alkylphenolica]|nr:hypothetical protein [Pseudomonas alkylphenolica]